MTQQEMHEMSTRFGWALIALTVALPTFAQIPPAPAGEQSQSAANKKCDSMQRHIAKEQRSLASFDQTIAADKKGRETCASKAMCAREYKPSISSYVARGCSGADHTTSPAAATRSSYAATCTAAARLSEGYAGFAGIVAAMAQRASSSLVRPDISVPKMNATSPCSACLTASWAASRTLSTRPAN